MTYRDDPWVTVTQINPRGRVDGTSDDDEPLQPESTSKFINLDAKTMKITHNKCLV